MSIVESFTEVQGDKVSIYIEVDEVPANIRRRRVGRGTAGLVADIGDAYGEGLELIRNCAAAAVERLGSMSEAIRPHEMEIEFAVKLDTEVGAIIAKMGGEAQLKVTLKWSKDK